MQAAEWIGLFKKLPDEFHELLMLATNNGVELAVQQILRLDDTNMLIRGRLGGTTESNRIFIVPYTYLSYVAFTRPISDQKLTVAFGELMKTSGPSKEMQEAEAAEGEATPAIDIAELPQIDVATLQPQARTTPATAPRSVAASLRERLLRARGGQRP